MGRSFRIGKIFGIPLMADFSFFLIFIFITLSLSMNFFPMVYEGWTEAYYWIIGIATSLLFAASLIAHETAHSIVSKRTGIPVISITLFFLGGVAQISREALKPKNELIMSLAGPLCSAALGGIFYALALLLDGVNVYLSALCSYLSYINLVLAVFNMIPDFPMDGGRVLRAVIWMVKKDYLQATRIATTVGYVISVCFIAVGIFLLFTQYILSGLWLIFIFFSISSFARTNYQQLLMRGNLKGYTAQDVISRDLPRIPRNINLMDLIEGAFLKSPHKLYLVTDSDGLVGILNIWQIKKVPQRQWSLTTVAHIMIPIEQFKTVSPADNASSIIEKFDQGQDDIVAVLNEGKVAGIITRQSLFDFAQRLQILKG
jgi:Zn-dependent protease/CBS domain-containing protein